MCSCTKASWCFILTVLIAVLVFRYVFQSKEHNMHTLLCLFLTNITFFASVCNAESTIYSAYSSSLGPGAMIYCTNTSVFFTSLMLYTTSVDNNRMSDCVELDWTCGRCTSQIGQVCGGTYKYTCGLAQQEVSCQVCIGNSNFVFTEQILLYVYVYN
jgi:hypothetical protein